jgi:outer membrane lipoprotein-sorting protein
MPRRTPIVAGCLLFIVLAVPALGQSAPLSLAPPKPAAGKTVPAPAPAAPVGAISPQEAVQRANAYFNASPTMIGDFLQISGEGRRLEGKVYVQRPGRMRFEYAKPATVEVVADGTSVAIRDRKLHTQDLYLIGQTPLKFLTKERIDISRDTKVLDVKTDAAAVSILIEDKATLGGTSRIKLIFDPGSFALKQWTVRDPQGAETVVSLFNVDFNRKPEPELFKIDLEKMIDTPRR